MLRFQVRGDRPRSPQNPTPSRPGDRRWGARGSGAGVVTAVVLGILAAGLFTGPVSAAGAKAVKIPTTLKVKAGVTVNPPCTEAKHPFATIAGALACVQDGDTIKIGPGTFAGGFTIPASVVLVGAAANKTIIANSSVLSVPEVTVAASTTVTLKDLSVDAEVGGGAGNSGIVAGSGSLTLEGVGISGTNFGGKAAIDVTPSSGTATVSVLDSSIFDNHSGGLYVTAAASDDRSTLSVINSTISGNETAGEAIGGVGVTNTDATLRNDTIANNFSTQGGGLVIGTSSAVTVTDTLLATNQSNSATTGDCRLTPGSSLTSGGHNLVGVATPGVGIDCGFTNGLGGDLVGSASAPLNPLLGALASNGGDTETQALEPGSPAIGAGNPADCEAAPVNDLDQRGRSRAASTRGSCDIGSYDTGGRDTTTWTVSAAARANSTCAKPSHPFASIAGALACAHSGDEVEIGPGTFAGGFTIPASVALVGAGANATIIANQTESNTPEVTVAGAEAVTLRDLSVNAEVEGHFANRGVVAGSGSLTLESVSVSGVDLEGTPAVDVVPVTGNANVTVFDSSISDNHSGGLYVTAAASATPSTLSVTNSTLSGNEGAGDLGGLGFANTDATLRDDTIANNYSVAVGGLELGASSAATVTDTLLATNQSSTTGSADCLELPTAKLTSGGHNLVGESLGTAVGCEFKNGINGDRVGSPSAPLNPLLGALASNGGDTETQALEPDSPAIGAGNPADCEAVPVDDLDQRGDSRAASTRGSCDIGAYDTGGA